MNPSTPRLRNFALPITRTKANEETPCGPQCVIWSEPFDFDLQKYIVKLRSSNGALPLRDKLDEYAQLAGEAFVSANREVDREKRARYRAKAYEYVTLMEQHRDSPPKK